MMKKIFMLVMALLCIACITGCRKKKVTIESITVIESTVPSSILNTEVESKLTTIKFNVNKSDDSKEEKNLDKSMISNSDLAKLSKAGKYTIIISYEGVTTTLTLTIEEEVEDCYMVKVLYPNNTPVSGGVAVQWCTNTNCLMPVLVDENGVAKSKIADDDYYIHIEGIPAGYTYDPNGYTANANNKYVEIKLMELSTIASGDGSEGNPYVVSTGIYNISFDKASTEGMKYFSFTATESKTYTIESLSTEKLAVNAIDPYIGFGPSFDVSGNTEESINFSHSFEATAGTTYTFVIMVSSATFFPASFDFTISSK